MPEAPVKSNWFLVHRALLESDLWLDEAFSRGQAWLDLIGLANHKSGHIRVRGIRVPIKRGQVGWSELRLSERWKWSRGKVRRFLAELRDEEMVDYKTDNKTMVITISNYERYQFKQSENGQQNEQQTDSRRTADGHEQRLKEGKEERQGASLQISSQEKIKDLIHSWNGSAHLIQKALAAIKSTRKSGKLADSVVISFLEKLQQYDAQKVKIGIQTYLDRGYYLDGKAEKYLLGIIRNVTPEQVYISEAGNQPTIQPRSYAQAQDAEKRSQAQRVLDRLRKQKEGQHGQSDSDQGAAGPAQHRTGISEE